MQRNYLKLENLGCILSCPEQQMRHDMWTSPTRTSLKYNVEEHQGLPKKNKDLRHQSS